ncbi:MAG: nicotinate phosphoribosyltransferase, partial [Pirellulaceae bacterium]
MIDQTYGTSLALLTDLYQLTMGYGYWKNRMHQHRAVFHLFFRSCPFGGQYAIAAGLQTAVDWLQSFQVTDEDAQFLATLTGNNAQALFSDEFLGELTGMQLSVDIEAIPEGTIVFAHEPLLRVTGPLWQCQWIETALLNIVNFQTLIATKSARVCDAAMGEPILEFGLRRAQGIDGALSASRAAYIGGC